MASVEKQTRNGKPRWQARWRDDAGQQRKRTFDRKVDADRFLTTVEADLIRGTYLDPDAGRITFKVFADSWLTAQTFGRSTREAVALRLRLHVHPVLGGQQLGQIRPSVVQAWLGGLDALAPSYRRVIYTNVSTIFNAAVDDNLIGKNPCRAGSVRRPKVEPRKVVPWPVEQVLAVRSALPQRYGIVATLAAGLGLRQGEVFGLSSDDVDFLRGRVEVRRQVQLLPNGSAVFALPKGGKSRAVPLPDSVRDELAAYLAAFRPRRVALPWVEGAEQAPVPLVLTSREGKAMNRNYFNSHVWKTALKEVGVAPNRDNGCHALRHFYASVLLDAGESIRAVSEYLGHSDPGFTLRTYTHLMPASDQRTRRAVDAALTPCAPTVPLGGSDTPFSQVKAL